MENTHVLVCVVCVCKIHLLFFVNLFSPHIQIYDKLVNSMSATLMYSKTVKTCETEKKRR
jgi:hypothetical protein